MAYYTKTEVTAHTLSRAAAVNAQFAAIETGFALLPAAAVLGEGRANYVSDTGGVNAYLVTMSPTATAYTVGMEIVFIPDNNNTGASTVNVDSLGVKSIKRRGGDALVAGDLSSAAIAMMRYDGSEFQMQSIQTTSVASLPLSVANGGTAATSAAGARSSLSAAALGANSDITSITGLTTDLTVAQGGTGAGTFTDGGVLLGSGTGAITAMAVLADGEIIVGDGTTDPVAESGATARTSLGAAALGANSDITSITGLTTDLTVAQGGTGAGTFTDGGILLGSGTGAVTAMAVLADSEMIVGDGTTDPVAESGATLRTSIGVGTGDSPQLTGIELGHATDSTITRASAGDINVEGNVVYRAGGTDVPVADGGTGASTHTANNVLVGAGTSAITSVAPSTSGNVLTSSGSAWTSAAAASPAIAAAAGIMQANANFVDAVIFGPAMDPVDWSGRTAANTASLMLATLEDLGSTSEVNVWDLTSTTIASATPLATITLSSGNPEAIAASMGYIIVGSLNGTFIVDPHDGVWQERTVGWPRRLQDTTVPALHSQNVGGVTAGFSDAPAYDPRTGGPLPSFGVKYTSGTKQGSLIKDDGNVWDITGGGSSAETGCLIHNSRLYFNYNNEQLRATQPISTVNSNLSTNPPRLFVYNDNYPYSIAAAVDKMSAANRTIALASGEGLGFNLETSSTGRINAVGGGNGGINASVTRVFNTGYYTEYTKGIWLANSKTVDRGPLPNTLTENGTVTEAAVETGAELLGYSGFTASNNLSKASDADWDVITTGSAYLSCWVKSSGNSAQEYFINFGNSGATVEFILLWDSAGRIEGRDDGATAQTSIATSDSFDDGIWHKADFVRVSSTERYLYVDGVLKNSSTTDAGSLSDDGNLPLYIGVLAADGSSGPADDSTLALAKLSVTAPTATQIRQMYDAEKGMFVASAKCLLQSGSTDAVLDVSVDPITSKVAVTQTDSQMIWNGLVMESAPAVNAGASEHNKLFGGDRVEINSVNLYATIAAKSLRGDLELVRGLKAGLPAGPDLGKCKAWCYIDSSGGINASYNIKSVTDNATGNFTFHFGIPFKSVAGQSAAYSVFALAEPRSTYAENSFFQSSGSDRTKVNINNFNTSATGIDSLNLMMGVFGELENE